MFNGTRTVKIITKYGKVHRGVYGYTAVSVSQLITTVDNNIDRITK